MSDHEACVTASDLIALSSGRLSTADMSRVTSHVECCPRCQVALEKIAAAPTVAHERVDVAKPEFLGPPHVEGDLGSIEHYRVLALLGEGGMGAVYKGLDTLLQRPVAIKVMKNLTIPFAKERMLREAQTTAGLSSEHVAAVYQVGTTNGLPYLAMELLEGEPLEDRLAKGKPRLDEVLRWSREIAEGLAAAHAKGLIHRDIKPANIWLSRNGKVKILDFGLSRSVDIDMRLTQTGFVMGTPHYMSPEQATDGPMDARSDLFSLGCVMYRMATGKLAFAGTTLPAVMTKLATLDPPPVTVHEPGVPQELSDVIERLLSKQPDDRPARAADVADQLRGIERNLPLSSLPLPSSGRQPRRKSASVASGRRWYPWLLGGGAMAALALAAWSVGIFMRSAPKPPSTGHAGADPIDKALAEPRDHQGAPPPADTPRDTWAPPGGLPEPPSPPAWNIDVTKLEQYKSELVGKPGMVYVSALEKASEDLSARGPPPGIFTYPVVADNVYSPHGIFQHGRTSWVSISYRLDGKYERFWSKVALNDSVMEEYCSPFYFYVYGDGKELWHSPKMSKTGVINVCDISVKGVQELKLGIYCTGSIRGTHAVWIEPSLSEE